MDDLYPIAMKRLVDETTFPLVLHNMYHKLHLCRLPLKQYKASTLVMKCVDA